MNTLGDLNDKLFEQLDRLTKDELTNEQLSNEIMRSKAVVNIAGTVIKNGELLLKTNIAVSNNINQNQKLPKMLEG